MNDVDPHQSGPPVMGNCLLTLFLGRQPSVPTSLAYATPAVASVAALRVEADFGCIQFTKREP